MMRTMNNNKNYIRDDDTTCRITNATAMVEAKLVKWVDDNVMNRLEEDSVFELRVWRSWARHNFHPLLIHTSIAFWNTQ